MPKITLRQPITILVTLEGLATAALSCYGCSWNETPEIDALATQGVVWDRWTSPLDRPNGLVQQWLSATSAGFADRLESAASVFATDDHSLAIPEFGNGFSKSIRMEPTPSPLPCDRLDQTVLAQSFATAIGEIDASTKLIWIHSSALRDHWDAPIHDQMDVDLEDQEGDLEGDAVDDDSPEPLQLPLTTEPPALAVSEDVDPDLVFAWMNRYAAQVRVLDTMIGMLAAAVSDRKATIVLAGASGFCLGENGWIGHRVGPLRSAEIRLPMIVSSGGPLRVPAVRSATDLPRVIGRILAKRPIVSPAEWCAGQDEFNPAIHTESDRSSCAITTPTWFYVCDKGDLSEPVASFANESLYLKPDDICDVNDVSRLRREVVDQFSRDDG